MKINFRRQGLYNQLKKAFLAEFVEAILAAIVVALILRFFIVSVYRVPSESMQPTLYPGDMIVAWKTSYGVPVPFSDRRLGARLPERGDVVVIERPDEDALFVKRVIGLPGDRIEIRDGQLWINDASAATLVETVEGVDYFAEFTGKSTHRVMRRQNAGEADFLAPLVVPPDHIFLLGDFRSDSADSRQWGAISANLIVARAAFVGASLQPAGSDASGRIRFDRFLKPIE